MERSPEAASPAANARRGAPRYCPRCRVASPSTSAGLAGSLCVECGETLRPQAYCPTCEDYWMLEPGDPCPKHEVELLDEAPPTEVPPLGEDGRPAELVTIATYNHPNEANGPRIRLEAEGIPTFLQGEHIARNTLWQVATGGVKLQVPASLASAARVLLAQTWTDAKHERAADELEDAWEDLAPEPGVRRRFVMKVAICCFLFGPIVVLLLAMLIDLFA